MIVDASVDVCALRINRCAMFASPKSTGRGWGHWIESKGEAIDDYAPLRISWDTDVSQHVCDMKWFGDRRHLVVPRHSYSFLDSDNYDLKPHSSVRAMSFAHVWLVWSQYTDVILCASVVVFLKSIPKSIPVMEMNDFTTGSDMNRFLGLDQWSTS